MRFNSKTLAYLWDGNQIHSGYLVEACGMQVIESCDTDSLSLTVTGITQHIGTAQKKLEFSKNDIVFSFPLAFQINHQTLNALVQSSSYSQKVGTPLPQMQPVQFYGLMTLYRQGQVAFYALENQMPVNPNSLQAQAVQKTINDLLQIVQKARQDENQVREILRTARQEQEREDKKSQRKFTAWLEQLKNAVAGILRRKKNEFVEQLHASFVARVKHLGMNTAIEQILMEFNIDQIKKNELLFLDVSQMLARAQALPV